MMVKVIKVQCIVEPGRGEVLIHCHGIDGEIRVKVESFPDASDELFQGDIQTVARKITMVGERVDTGTWTAN